MLIDISPKLTDTTAVFPGDTPLSREVLFDCARGDAITLSTLRSTVHLGAHADAPSHYAKGGATIDRQPLDLYLGPAQVISTPVGPGKLIEPAHIGVQIRTSRVLLRTGTWSDHSRFNTDFAAISPDLVGFLSENGVKLVGIDTPSVDPADSKDLPAHKAFFRTGLSILECLDLEDVDDGMYELIALPLRLVGFDASPVRAVLRPLTAQTVVDL
jgi:arylformamidase